MRAGEYLEGTLVEIDDDCLIINAGDREVILEAESIDMVERLAAPGGVPAPAAVPVPAVPVPAGPPPVVPREPVFPDDALRALAGLRRTVLELPLEISAPEFTVYADDLDAALRDRLNKDLVTIRNRYAYALKIRERARVLRCIDDLRTLRGNYDAPDALQIAGRMAWFHGEYDRALELFAEAADELADGSSCFDLAMAQRRTDEREYAARTLASCVTEASPADDRALLALTAGVLTEDVGTGELAALVEKAGGWRPCPARRAVLKAGLLCVPLPKLTGFPAEEWDAPEAPASAFEIVARTLRTEPVPPAPPAEPASGPAPGPRPRPAAPRQAPARQVPRTSAPSAPAFVTATPNGRRSRTGDRRPEIARVMELGDAARTALDKKDFEAAERALATLQEIAPQHSVTWGVQRDLSNLRNAAKAAAATAARTGGKNARAGARWTGPFVRAEAALRRNEVEQARRFLHQAIEQGDQPARAVRRLAELLSTRLRLRDDALALLDEHKHLFRTPEELWGWSQERSTTLEHAGRWDEASAELQNMLDSGPTGNDRARVAERLVDAYIQSFRYEDAERLAEAELERAPGQRSLRAKRDQLVQARKTGVYSKVEAMVQLQSSATSDLSPLLTFHLDRCEYRGVRAESMATRNFTEKDINRLDELVSGRADKRVLGSDYPRERADYNLSAARIMRDLGITDDGFRSRLRYFAAAMGDACALEAKGNADVIRTYYSEAVSVKGEWDKIVDVKLRQLVMSFTTSDPRLLETKHLPSLERSLEAVMKERHLATKVLVALLSLPTAGETVTRLIRMIWADHATRGLFQQVLAGYLDGGVSVADKTNFTTAWLAAANKCRERRAAVYGQISVLTETGSALSTLDRHASEFQQIRQDLSDLESATDLARLEHCLAVVRGLRQYIKQDVYVERERLFGTVGKTIRDHLLKFESAPTLMSLQYLHPYLTSIEKELKEHFEQYQASVEPDELQVDLVVNRYLPGGGKVDVQLQVSNGPGASPVGNVELEVMPSEDYTVAKAIVPVSESIAASESKTCQVSLVAREPAIEQKLLTLSCRIHFTLRSQRRVTVPVDPKSIHLSAEDEWTDIPNPYSPGLPVEDEKMFKGRERLIADLVETLTGPHHGSVIVYGQKRAGKSSVLLHLAKKLELPGVAASFSISGNIDLAVLLYEIGDQFHWELSSRSEFQHPGYGPPPQPDLEQIRLAPQQKFKEYLRLLQAWLRNHPTQSDAHLVLLIDEFSVVHKEIRVGNLERNFMKGWKAMLEQGFFRCVLVGNDLMPTFIQEFPNEFQVANEMRVSYLDRSSAVKLIEDPIRLPDGASRYRGNAVERILELTGCSAYYIQLFCQHLVEYMNSEDVRGPAIGPADVETVADRLIGTLGENEFNNLLTPGDQEVTDIGSDLVSEVLRSTKRDAGRNMYHEADENAHPEAERVFRDLERREVVKRMSGNRYSIQVGLFGEWLQHRWG
ncbi:hypothetical protein [Actinomadura algeriensis]|uniref:Tetratricopeptide (TPR) repeat protein n=1 Tax=Actinomadura algeriensis TaxID=1679523 RepID=A0ABR9K303_9ACTN|nr:hypothetical protein [Actinomadura algeriensis]MBE1536715.1 tetratricopeptide (TPR) repeat protein [Actinomadura algeriensis]